MAENQTRRRAKANPADSQNEGKTDTEAKNLAREAMQELESGNREEAQFVLNEARELDPDAVEEVVSEAEKGQKRG